MAMLETVADHQFASDVCELKDEIKRLNKELNEQKDINNNLFCAIKNLSDVLCDQSDLLREIKNKM